MEKRKTPRVPLNVYLNKIVRDEVYMVRARDISVDGIWLTNLIEPEMAGEKVHLEFTLPDCDEVIWAAGEIVRRNRLGEPEGWGIRFTAMPSSSRELIALYVAANLDWDAQSEERASVEVDAAAAAVAA
ncbi:MAG: PilZ domain-containing protein [Deltaproteobacteria bacterium]|nr:MAG: PilZ domain-containing protein [Deltaproteobacteria bacterium]